MSTVTRVVPKTGISPSSLPKFIVPDAPKVVQQAKASRIPAAKAEPRKRISFIGCGQMGEAILKGLLASNKFTAEDVTVTAKGNCRLRELEQRFPGVTATDDNALASSQSDVILLSVKPQHSVDVLKPMRNRFQEHSLLISVMAGVNIDKLHDLTYHPASNIARCMPNTPALIGEGVTAWVGAKGMSDDHILDVQQILGSFGKQVRLEQEAKLDTATALSGSAPAYVYLMMESMIDAGVRMGMTREDSKRLVVQTVKGSAMMAEGEESLSDLRHSVCSPGGCTAEGVYQLERGGFRTNVMEAMQHVHDKASSLGRLG